MSTQIQRRRGTTAEHSTFTGVEGELTVDTTKDTVVVHDGATVGGHPLQKQYPALGSASAPTYTFTGDTNTGIYSPGADQLALSTSGVGRVFVDASGRVGIGTTPSYTLDVVGSSSAARVGKLLVLDDSPFVTGANLAANSSFAIGTQTAHSTIFFSNNTERLRITSAGLVGVGTSSPSSIIEAATTTDAVATVSAGSSGAFSAALFLNPQNAGGFANLTWKTGTPLRFATQDNAAGASFSERMRLDSSGRLGIGTSSPRTSLDLGTIDSVLTISPANASQGLRLGLSRRLNYGDGLIGKNLSGVSGSDSYLTPGNGTGYSAIEMRNGGDTIIYASNASTTAGASVSPPARLIVKGDTGNVGIGTTSPGNLLELKQDTPAFRQTSIGESGGYAATFGLTWNTTSTFSISANATGQSPVKILDWGSNGNLTLNYSSSLNSRAFIVKDGALERARIDSSGRLLIGTSSNLGSSGQFQLKQVVTTGYCSVFEGYDQGGTAFQAAYRFPGGSLVGSITSTSTATAFNTSSDYRLKENVTPVTDGITRLQQLKPSRFNFIADPSKTVDGFIAHEVQAVVPEAITGEKDAVDDDGNPVYQGIDQSKLVPLLTAALQEAVAKIESLEARLTAAGI